MSLTSKYKLQSFELTNGIRFDVVPYNNNSIISPRLGLTFVATPITKFNAAIGKYYQTPFYWILMNPNNQKMIDNSYTNQLIVGIEHYFASDIRLTLEIYNKDYHNRPISISDITENPLDNYLGFIDTGTGNSKGLELFLQKKSSQNWYGTLSYSYSKAISADFREGKSGFYTSDFDCPNALTIVGGYKFNFRKLDWYQNIREKSIFKFTTTKEPFII